MSRKEKSLPEYQDELTKEDKKYLNSKKRMIKSIVWRIVEYIIVIVVFVLLISYIQNGNLDNAQNEISGISKWLQPGGLMFNAIVGFLPIIILGSIGTYFGEGTYGRMLFGIVRCLAILLFINLVLSGASNSIELPEVFKNMGLEGININFEGLAKFFTLVLLCSLLIPIGEFLGARKKHIRMLSKQKALAEKS